MMGWQRLLAAASMLALFVASALAQPVPASAQLRLSTTLGSTRPTSRVPLTTTDKSVVDVRGDQDLVLLAKQYTAQQRTDNAVRNAVALAEAGLAPQAIAVLEPLLRTHPENSAARQLLAGLLIDDQRRDDAGRCLQAGLLIDPLHLDMAMMLARLQVDGGDLHGAITSLQRVETVSAGQARYQAFLAALLQRDQRHREAAAYYAIALRSAPQNALWWLGYGVSLRADNQLEAAVEAFRQASDSPMLSAQLRAFVDQGLLQMAH